MRHFDHELEQLKAKLLEMSALVEGVVETVRVAVAELVPETVTGLVEPKLSVGRWIALAGLEVICADKATDPVNPLGVRVTVEVFPVVAPRETVMAVAANVKVAAGILMV